MIQIWQAIHSDIGVGLSDIFEYPRNIRIGGLTYKLSIPLCRNEVKKRSFAVRCVNIWSLIPAEAVVSKKFETFKAQLDRFLGNKSYEFSNTIEKKTLLVSCTCIVNV